MGVDADAALYEKLSQVADGKGDATLFEKLNAGSRKLDWQKAEKKNFTGHLRIIRVKSGAVSPDARPIYLESGKRNGALAMTIALLIQDKMGDFYSSMFFTAGIFSLVMYVAGVIGIFAFKIVLPVKESSENAESSA